MEEEVNLRFIGFSLILARIFKTAQILNFRYNEFASAIP
jgi:type IV secretory pathway VirB9-like protein